MPAGQSGLSRCPYFFPWDGHGGSQSVFPHEVSLGGENLWVVGWRKVSCAYGFVLDFFSSVGMVAFGIAIVRLSIFLVCPSLAAGMASWGIVLS